MILSHVWGLMAHPDREWHSIREEHSSIFKLYLSHILLLAAIPAVCGYIGTTMTGWTLPGGGEIHRLTADSALTICVLAWCAMMVGVAVMGGYIQWLAQTFDRKPALSDCIAFSAYTATPIFLAGISALWPSLWLAMIAGIGSVSYSVWLLYGGLPIFMDLPKEKSFVFASAILCIGLVMMVAMLAITVIFWGMDIGPEYL
ncbi:Yip1 family protein [Endozoicomonadaceae bacterium StTr2]